MNGDQDRATCRFRPGSLDTLNFLLSDVRGALGPYLNVYAAAGAGPSDGPQRRL